MEKHSRAILYFDGICHLCHGAVQFILKHEATDQIRFATLQSTRGMAIKQKLTSDGISSDSMVFSINGQLYTRSEAALEIAKHLKMPWRGLRVLRFIPQRIRDFMYDLVARNRYRVFGKKDQCEIPSSPMTHRFLDSA